MKPGAAFLIRFARQAPRLGVIIAPRNAETKLLFVYLEPHESDSDESCAVLRGEHPDVREDCIVRYSRAKYVSELDLRKGRQRGAFDLRTPCSPKLLQRIQRGALASRFTEPAALPRERPRPGGPTGRRPAARWQRRGRPRLLPVNNVSGIYT